MHKLRSYMADRYRSASRSTELLFILPITALVVEQCKSSPMTIISNRGLAVVRVSTIGSLVFAIITQTNAFLNDVPLPYAAYGPNPYLFVLFIVAQMALQAYWLTKLFPYKVPVPTSTSILSEDEDDSEREVDTMQGTQTIEPLDVDATQLAYTPIFVLGNICLSVWSYFWVQERYSTCQIALIFNTTIHLYAVYALHHSHHNPSQVNETMLTHQLSKTSTGLAILYMWKTWGAVDKTTAPPSSEQLQTLAFFLLMTLASGPDPTLGICLICNLVAMILGPYQVPEWHTAFMYMAPTIAIVMAVDYYLDARRRIGVVQRVEPPHKISE